MGNYPEHEKMEQINDLSQEIGLFLDWLSAKGVTLCTWEGDRYYSIDGDIITQSAALASDDYLFEEGGFHPFRFDTNRLLAGFFGIDYDELQNEKDQMLKKLRELNQ